MDGKMVDFQAIFQVKVCFIMQFFNVSGTRLACFTRLFKTNSGWPRGNPSPCFLGCKCFAQKFGAGLGTLISQHFCSRGEVPWANPHQWPAANNGPSVSTMDRAQTSAEMQNARRLRSMIFFASCPSKIWWNCTLMPNVKGIKNLWSVSFL